MTVVAMSTTRPTARKVCSPKALKASSGPYEELDSPSAPRPTQARNGIRARRWKRPFSSRSRGPPKTSRLSFWLELRRAPPPGDARFEGGVLTGRESNRARPARLAARSALQPAPQGVGIPLGIAEIREPQLFTLLTMDHVGL